MDTETDWIELSRDCEAVVIPAGNPILLPQGTKAVVTQSLGGSFTLHVQGYGLMRISNRDADAIGREPEPAPAAAEPAAPRGEDEFTEAVWNELRTCYDPEIPVNIVDLGLVYDLQVAPMDDGRRRVDVKMTLTAQGCGMGPSIAADAKYKILSLPDVGDAEVEIVWSPQWNPNMISPAGREKLGME
ncbi:MAG: putative Fe-S cluster assembly protein SufT [Alphaproteobacteria bacterium]